MLHNQNLFPNSIRKILTWAKRLFTPVALIFLVYVGWQSRAVLTTLLINAKLNYLGLATLLLMAPHFVLPIATTRILKACGASVSYQFALQTQINRLPARYLPGGVWHTVGRLMDFHTQGVKPTELTGVFLVENILAIAVAFLLGCLGMGYFRGLTEGWGQLAVLLMLGNVLGLIITPLVIRRWVGSLQLRFYLQAIGWYIPLWFLFASGFVCYFAAFPLIWNDMSGLEVGSTYLFAWAVGLVAPFAPQGIGIFEAVAGHLLSGAVSIGGLAALIAGFRGIGLVADVTLWGVFRGWCLLKKS